MTDVTVGSSAVLTSGPEPVVGLAGAAITINQTVYLDQTVSPPVWKLADADALASAQTVGIALNTAPSGGRVMVAGRGCRVTMSGATFVVGTAYYASTTAGGICPEADLASGDFPFFLGFAPTATALDLACVACGVAKA